MACSDVLELEALTTLEGIYHSTRDEENSRKVQAFIEHILNGLQSDDKSGQEQIEKLEDATLTILEAHYQEQRDERNLEIVHNQRRVIQQARQSQINTRLPMCFLAATLELQISGEIVHSLPEHAVSPINFGFTFDIDGVLTKDFKPLPGSRFALQKLQKAEIPFIFMTNSGGCTEAEKAKKMTRQFDLKIEEEHVILSHTPFRDLVPELKDKAVLVIGGVGDDIANLARSYGFNNVVSSTQLQNARSEIYPFREPQEVQEPAEHILKCAHGSTPMAAILIWTNSRDWGTDLQIILDLLLSEKGHIGTRSPYNGDTNLLNSGYLQDGQPTIYFCNPDIDFPSSFPQTRIAQGTFRAALDGIWATTTGGANFSTHISVCGKPSTTTYLYGENALRDFHELLHARRSYKLAPPLKTIYMVGDNPASDIAGTNAFSSPGGVEWKSILVETGVFQKGAKPSHEPTMIVSGVKEAVEWALSQEGFEGADD